MFNIEKRVSLSEFAKLGDIVRDTSFFGVGKIPSRVQARVVPVQTPAHLREVGARNREIAGVICPPQLASQVPKELGCLASPKPLVVAYEIQADLAKRPDHYWTRFETRIAASARIHPGAQIARYDVEIGENTQVDAGAVIHERSIVGAGCIIGSATVIGTNAFELVRIDGINRLQVQSGGVRIGRNSIFLSGTMVARSVFATFTEIGENCAFDNLVHIAHDCVIGEGSQITACGILAGRVTLGDGSFVGPNATISNGVSVGESSSVTIGSTVVRDVEAGQKVTGYFATDHRAFLRTLKRDRD